MMKCSSRFQPRGCGRASSPIVPSGRPGCHWGDRFGVRASELQNRRKLDLLRARSQGISIPPEGLNQEQRAITISKIARFLREIGISEEGVDTLTDIANGGLCNPPLSIGESKRCVELAKMYEADSGSWMSGDPGEAAMCLTIALQEMWFPRTVAKDICSAFAGIELRLPDYEGIATSVLEEVYGGELYAA